MRFATPVSVRSFGASVLVLTVFALNAPADDDVILQMKGYVIAAHEVRVSPKIAGTVVWLHENFEEGRRFKQGAVLARLEDEEFKADLDKAKAILDRARARLDGLDRAAKPAERAIAKADVDEAEAELRKARWRLESCTIRAPISGIILARSAEKGNLVSPAAYQLGASVCQMADLTDLEIEVSVPEADIVKLKTGQKCTVMPEAFAKSDDFLKKHRTGYRATLARIMPAADRAKGAIGVRVKIDKADLPAEEEGIYLKPDMSVLVSFRKTQTER